MFQIEYSNDNHNYNDNNDNDHTQSLNRSSNTYHHYHYQHYAILIQKYIINSVINLHLHLNTYRLLEVIVSHIDDIKPDKQSHRISFNDIL